jgi:hypothetical protein
MRKLLLASAAVIGVASAAQAQMNQNTSPAPNTPGVNQAANGGPASGGTSTPAGLAPGQIIVRMNGRFNWYAGFMADGDANAMYYYDSFSGTARSTPIASTNPGLIATGYLVTNAAGAVIDATTATGNSNKALPMLSSNGSSIVRGQLFASLSSANSYVPSGGHVTAVTAPGLAPLVAAKQNQGVAFASYIRLYPGFDGMAANGLRYGVSAEIRQDQTYGSGGGVYGSVSRSTNQRGGMYWRRAYGYVAGDSWGTVRFGSGDGPSSLFMTGNFENFNDSGWNGDLPSMVAPALALTWPFADVGSMYSLNKLVYLSPSFMGFDFGASWAPTSNSMNQNDGCQGFNIGTVIGGTGASPGIAGIGCDRLASLGVTSDGNGSTLIAENGRVRNVGEAFLRYRGAFGPVGISAYGGYIGSGQVNDTFTSIGTSGVPFQTAAKAALRDGLSVGVGGAQISFAGATVGGMVQGGRFNGQWGLSPKGAEDSLAWLGGASYTTGPIIVGASYYEYHSPGSFIPLAASVNGAANSPGSDRRERGLAAGGTYAVAPGMSLFLSYLWGDRHQTGVNFDTGEVKGNTSVLAAGWSQHNLVTVQAVSLGAQLRW